MTTREVAGIELETIARVRVIRFARPEKKHALTHAMYEVLVTALAEAEADAGIRVIVFTGDETAFTSGNDIADFLKNPPQDDEAPVMRFLYALAASRKPMLAAVCGVAVGIGTTLLLHCDLVVAGTNARFSLPFVDRALCCEGASSVLLAQRVGQARAAEWLMLGDAFDAATALHAGLINRVVEPAQALATALELAQRIAAKPPGALRSTRALLRQNAPGEVVASIRAEAAIFREQLQSPEAREAFAAFLEKRQPDFSAFD